MPVLEARQRFHQLRIIHIAFVAFPFDAGQNLPDGVHHGQQGGDGFLRDGQLPIPQFTEQAFAHMRDGFQFGKPQKTTGSLECMNRSKNTGQQAGFIRLRFQDGSGKLRNRPVHENQTMPAKEDKK